MENNKKLEFRGGSFMAFIPFAVFIIVTISLSFFNAADQNMMIGAGVIDPTKVSRVALENAASVASMLLTTECVLADEPKEGGAAAAGVPPMGGGMPGMM